MAESDHNHVIMVADLRHGDSGPWLGAVLGPLGGPGPRVAPWEPPAANPPGDCDALYLGPGEITNRAAIEQAARVGLPLLLDTTGATLKETTRAAGWHQLAFRGGDIPRLGGRLAGLGSLCLLHGTVQGAPPNLRALARVAGQTFVAVGLVDTSDQGLGGLAVALGARVIVRRPPGLAEYEAELARAVAALGTGHKHPDACELAAVHAQRRRLVARRDIAAGTVIGPDDLAAARPGPGPDEFAPYQQPGVEGRRAARDIAGGAPLRTEDLDGQAPSAPAWFAPRPPREKPQ
ncbi:MAG: hypothetical protein HS108_05620 [Planctomycetes bacterium]|nr:hypothetical protein [Planctomycetota bacterium]MCL4729084.1 hypothetical protein [Planctomycetota bacterium]